MLLPTLAGGAPDAQASTVVEGQLGGGGRYIVVGVTRKGTGPSARARRDGSFRLRFPGRSARGATIHLIKPRGAYYGPVVLRRSRRGAYAALSGDSAKLGRIRLRRGYAAPRRQPKAALVSTKRFIRLRRGKPVGAGRLGLVDLRRGRRVARTSAAQPPPDGPAPPSTPSLGVDSDRDGLTNNYDVDDDGDAVLDSLDPDTGPPQNQLGMVFTNLKVSLERSQNANGATVNDDAIDRLLEGDLVVTMVVNPLFALPGQRIASVNVDCFQLAYCAKGNGTGTVNTPPDRPGPPEGSRWTEYDPDRDGYPNLVPGREDTFEISVLPHAGQRAITPQDALNFQIETESTSTIFSSTVGPYFVTTPGIASLDDGAATHRISYPPKPGDPGTNRSEDAPPGVDNAIKLQGSKLTLSFWRPQRPALPGEAGEYRDMGGLGYFIYSPGGTEACKAEDYSALSSTLSVTSDGFYTLLHDAAGDAAPDPDRRLSFSVDLAQCAAREGVDVRGQVLEFGLEARAPNGANAAQSIWVKFPG
jgi:hypothetical protein